jgi:hypothetical protein
VFCGRISTRNVLIQEEKEGDQEESCEQTVQNDKRAPKICPSSGIDHYLEREDGKEKELNRRIIKLLNCCESKAPLVETLPANHSTQSQSPPDPYIWVRKWCKSFFLNKSK